MAKELKNSKGNKGKWMKYLKLIIQGRAFSLAFFKAHWGFILMLVVLFCVSISNRYTCQNKMKTIAELQKELVDAKTNRVQAAASYKALVVPSKIKVLVDVNSLDLKSPAVSPIKIVKPPKQTEQNNSNGIKE